MKSRLSRGNLNGLTNKQRLIINVNTSQEFTIGSKILARPVWESALVIWGFPGGKGEFQKTFMMLKIKRKHAAKGTDNLAQLSFRFITE